MFHYFNAKLFGKTPVWQLCDSSQMFDLIKFQNNSTWPDYNSAGISLDSWLKYNKITHRYAKKLLPIHLVLVLISSNWYRFHPFFLSISQVLSLCGINARELHLSKTCWELWLSDEQPHSDYKGQWQRPLCMVAVPNQTHRGINTLKNVYYKTN